MPMFHSKNCIAASIYISFIKTNYFHSKFPPTKILFTETFNNKNNFFMAKLLQPIFVCSLYRLYI